MNEIIIGHKIDHLGLWRDGACSVAFWEEAIQSALASALIPAAEMAVIEIGYGLGLAHNRLRELSPRKHVLIELDEGLVPKALSKEVCLIADRWQSANAAISNGIFDAVFFDPDPDEPADDGWTVDRIRHWSLDGYKQLRPKLRRGGRFGFLDFTGLIAKDPSFCAAVAALGGSIHRTPFQITPPEWCMYAKAGYSDLILIQK